MDVCVLTLLNDMKVMTIDDHASESVLIRGKYNNQDVVAKISPQSPKNDNSLDIERALYLFVDQIMSKFTPHFLGGIRAQQCDASELSAANLSQNRMFLKQWNRMRGNLLLTWRKEPDTFISEDTIKNLKDRFDGWDDPAKLGMWQEFVSREITHYFNQIHYVLTPAIDARTLRECLRTKVPSYFDMHIAIQVAQALAVAEQYGFMHNDMHAGNIFVIDHRDEKPFHYTVPFEFDFHSQFEVKIFDYNLSSIYNAQVQAHNLALDNEFCAKIGACSDFTPNYDWDLFLVGFVSDAERRRETPLRALVGGRFGDSLGPMFGGVGENAMFAHDCICNEIDPTKSQDDLHCIKCTRTRNPNISSTPVSFLQSRDVSMFIQRPVTVVPPRNKEVLLTTPGAANGTLSELEWKEEYKTKHRPGEGFIEYVTTHAPEKLNVLKVLKRQRAVRYHPYTRPNPTRDDIDLTRLHI